MPLVFQLRLYFRIEHRLVFERIQQIEPDCLSQPVSHYQNEIRIGMFQIHNFRF